MKTKHSVIAPMVVSAFFFVGSSWLEKRVSRTKEKDTADTGTTPDEKRKDILLENKNAVELGLYFFVEGFLIYYFQTSYICALENERK